MIFATKNNSKVSLLMTCESVFLWTISTPPPLLNWSTYLRHLYEQKYHYSTQAKTELGCISLITLPDINSQQGQVVSIIVSKIAPEDLVPPIVCKQQLSVCLRVQKYFDMVPTTVWKNFCGKPYTIISADYKKNQININILFPTYNTSWGYNVW